MPTNTTDNASKAVKKAKSGSAIAVFHQEDAIVQKTLRMTETMKKYPLPGK